MFMEVEMLLGNDEWLWIKMLTECICKLLECVVARLCRHHETTKKGIGGAAYHCQKDCNLFLFLNLICFKIPVETFLVLSNLHSPDETHLTIQYYL